MKNVAWGPRIYADLEAKARARGLSMGALADALDLSRSLFHRWKHGTHPLYGTVAEVNAYLDTLAIRDAVAAYDTSVLE